ncbi:MAG TPA: hypothetical protein VF834_04185 [Streptosporangiaceae bacterium]
MNIRKIAAFALAPAAVTGIAVSGVAAVQAATSHPSSHGALHPVHRAAPHKALHQAGLAAHQSAGKHVSSARTASAGHRAHARASQGKRAGSAVAAHSTASSSSSLFSGMSAFERCVAWRESGDNPRASSAGLFGILPATWASLGYPGTAGQASVAMQKAAFNRLYAQYGTQPWAPYDGC